MRRPRKCWGCRCLQERPFRWDFYCGDFYKMKMVGNDPVPQEPCPKPRTWAEWNLVHAKGGKR